MLAAICAPPALGSLPIASKQQGRRIGRSWIAVLCPRRHWLWRRCRPSASPWRDAAGSRDPLSSDWLLEVPGLEARFGRLGAEFQQLLEGSGESQLGEWREGDLFFAPAAVAAR